MLKTNGVVWHVTTSMDGYVADDAGRVDFMNSYVGPNELASAMMDNVGSILTGRRSFDIGTREGSQAYGGQVVVPTFVVTRRPPPADPYPSLTFLSGNDLAAAVATAKAAAKGSMVVIIGQAIAIALYREHLLDQLVVHMVPVMLGKGTPLYRDGAEPIRWKTIASSQAGQVTNLILEPAGER